MSALLIESTLLETVHQVATVPANLPGPAMPSVRLDAPQALPAPHARLDALIHQLRVKRAAWLALNNPESPIWEASPAGACPSQAESFGD